MSGAAIIRALLAARPSVTQSVPADANSRRLVAGQLRQDSVLPAISVTSVSSNEQATTARNLNAKMIRERIQVTVFTKDYMQLEKILKACSLGAGVHTGTVAGFSVRSILPEGVGPYFGPDGDEIHYQSRDFMVTFIEAN